MTSAIALSFDEIYEITGMIQPAAQLRHLRRMGIRAYRRADPEGSVCCLRAWLAVKDERSAQSRPTIKSDRCRPHEQTPRAR